MYQLPPSAAAGILPPGAVVLYYRLLVNGPCFVEGAEAIAPEFKRRMSNGQI